jgi:hypothetical protein
MILGFCHEVEEHSLHLYFVWLVVFIGTDLLILYFKRNEIGV